MNPFGLLFLGGIGYGIYRLTLMGAAAKTLSFSLGGLRLNGSIGLSGIPIRLIIKANNPTNQSISFQSFIGAINYNGKQLVQLSTINNQEIKANSVTDINITTTIPYLTVINAGIDISKGKLPTTLNITGILKATGIEIPVNQDVSFSS